MQDSQTYWKYNIVTTRLSKKSQNSVRNTVQTLEFNRCHWKHLFMVLLYVGMNCFNTLCSYVVSFDEWYKGVFWTDQFQHSGSSLWNICQESSQKYEYFLLALPLNLKTNWLNMKKKNISIHTYLSVCLYKIFFLTSLYVLSTYICLGAYVKIV